MILIDIVDSADDNVVTFGVIDGLFSDLTLLYLDGVDWVNEDVWKKVVIDDLIVVVVLGTTDDVVTLTRFSDLYVGIVWVNEVELQFTIGTDEQSPLPPV